MSTLDFRHLEDKQSYQLELEPGQWARLDYQQQGDILHLNHTIVPAALRGKNAAAKLLEYALQDIQDRGLKINPVCSYVQSYIKRNPQWQQLLPNGNQETVHEH